MAIPDSVSYSYPSPSNRHPVPPSGPIPQDPEAYAAYAAQMLRDQSLRETRTETMRAGTQLNKNPPIEFVDANGDRFRALGQRIGSDPVVAAAGDYAFELYLAGETLEDVAIRPGSVNPGGVMPTIGGAPLTDDPPPLTAGKNTGQHVAWLMVTHGGLATVGYHDFQVNATRYLLAPGGNMTAAEVLWNTTPGTPPTETLPGWDNVTGVVSTFPIFAIQIGVITGGIPQARFVAGLNRPIYIKFCPPNSYTIYPQ